MKEQILQGIPPVRGVHGCKLPCTLVKSELANLDVKIILQ